MECDSVFLLRVGVFYRKRLYFPEEFLYEFKGSSQELNCFVERRACSPFISLEPSTDKDEQIRRLEKVLDEYVYGSDCS